jgi:hypothetical protein
VNKQPPSLQNSIPDSRIVPSGRPIVRVASSSPITRIVHAPLRPMAPAKAATTIPRSVGVAIAGAKRKIAFMASSTAPFIPIDSEDPYDCLPQMYGTAFTASPPYPPPPPEAVASREELTDGLLDTLMSLRNAPVLSRSYLSVIGMRSRPHLSKQWQVIMPRIGRRPLLKNGCH